VPLPPLTRRSLLGGMALAAAGGVAGYLVAQGSDAADAKSATAAANGYGPSKAGTGGTGGEEGLTAVADLPAGGGRIVDGLVVTRDDAGDVRAFSATCTHQGCTVSSVAQGRIVCPCHGSVFDAATGAVVSGPATRPLPAVAVVIRNGQVLRA
jgi:Rieske Fe-S protein